MCPSHVENVWVGDAQDKLVFQWAGIPTPFESSGSRVTTMVAVDAMTAPDFRRRGLLTDGTGRACAAWREAGIAFVLGLPNEQYGSRKDAVGWRPLFPLQWMTRPLLPHAWLARRLGLPFIRHATAMTAIWDRLMRKNLTRDPDVRTSSLASSGKELDVLWERCKRDAEFSTVRDHAWVSWRFLKCPTKDYRVMVARRGNEPCGYLAYRIVSVGTRVSAQLVDMLVADDDPRSRDTLFDDLLRALSEVKAESLVTLLPSQTPLQRWLRRLGFVRGPSFQVHMIPLADRLPLERMRRAIHWRLSGADFDVV
jgi:hypothetical protein